MMAETAVHIQRADCDYDCDRLVINTLVQPPLLHQECIPVGCWYRNRYVARI